MKNHPLAPHLLLVLLALSFAAACGGSYTAVDDEEGASGGAPSDGNDGENPATGGAPASGGAPAAGGGEPGTGGAGAEGGTGGAPSCCLAEAVCNDGDVQIESGDDCAIGAECYSSTVCCSTVWCMKHQEFCDAIPICLDGELEVPECPEGSACVKREACGTVITCELQGEVVCDLGPQPDRNYIGHSAVECELIDFTCPAHTTGFSDLCGCGCEQPESCPDWVDCAPGQELDPLCSSEECPYTLRAQ